MHIISINLLINGEQEIKKLELILLFKSFGFSLENIKEILSTNDNITVVDIFSNQLKILNEKASQLNRYRDKITSSDTKSMDEIFTSMTNLIHILREMEAEGLIVIKRFE